ncbi:MAG: nucleotide exchange factor GrpE [Desulfotomaculaceae bacterium]|nr:nucleotide exchange factor GrpE [Desulfotomaculaceae bacterium]MDD4767658.1 nucleotide exchange factor GrpE [Desulfotomaculaceae bacterium]
MNKNTTVEQIDNISLLKKELDDEKNRHLRTLADFNNYRKRVEREMESSATRGKKELLQDLLAVLDNLERALPQIADERYRQGVEMIYQQFAGLLRQHGLERMDSVGQPFDPHQHEAAGYLENSGLPLGFVAQELTRGYRFGEDLLRPARVRVSRGPVKTR